MTDRCQDEISMSHTWAPAGAYQLWLAAAKDSAHALHAWLDGAPRDQAALYLAYRAALDREEAAAIQMAEDVTAS
jgi:hypothetical protein